MPHRGDVFLAGDYTEDFEDNIKKVDEELAGKVKDLRSRYYILTSNHGTKVAPSLQRIVTPYIDIDVCDAVLSGNYHLSVYYGSIVRNTKGGDAFILRTKWCHRNIGMNNWWLKPDCPRILRDPHGYVVTACAGFNTKPPISPPSYEPIELPPTPSPIPQNQEEYFIQEDEEFLL